MLTDTTTTTRSFKIGDLATRYGVSAEAIRQWERRGLIPPSIRTPGGHRRYSFEHRRALDRIIVPCVDDAYDRAGA